MRYRRDDLKTIATAVGAIEYRDVGAGEPVVFVHGAFVNGSLWDDVAFYLPPGLRLIRPDLPLGGHRLAAATGADLTERALAYLLLDMIDVLDLRDVILVGSDVGEAICQLAVASRHRRVPRIGGMLFTNCDVFDEHSPGHAASDAILDEAMLDGIARTLSTWEGRKAFFRRLAWVPPPDEQICDLLGGFVTDADVRRDALRVLGRTRRPRTRGPKAFDGPVKVLWGTEDGRLPVELGAKLAAQFANGELRRIPQARLLVPLDQPESVATAILDMLEERS